MATVALAAVTVLLATRGERLLPELMFGSQYKSPDTRVVLSAAWLGHVVALAILIWSTRGRRVIDLWIAVTILAGAIDLALSAILIGGRFQLGFYVGRFYGLLASSFVLALLLQQAVRLHGGLSRAIWALHESEARFRQFGDASSDVLWIRSADTLRFEYLSPAFDRVFGCPGERVLQGDHVEEWKGLIHPEDRASALAVLGRVRGGERVTHQYRIRRPADGQLRWIDSTDFPLLDDDGRVQRIAGIAKDVTQPKAASERTQVLVAELQHRTHNLMAVVSALADGTLSGSRSMEDFRQRFRERLAALSRAQRLLSRTKEGERVTFDELIRAELSAHGAVGEEGTGPQVALDGPHGVRLRSSGVQTFALALHELATNAVKYGALSNERGRLSIRWRLQQNDAGQVVRVDWSETGVSHQAGAEPLDRKGFGRELIEWALPYQLGAETTYQIAADGVRCSISVPLQGASQSEGQADAKPGRKVHAATSAEHPGA